MSVEAWCKVSAYLDSNPKIRRAGRAGREVYCFVLRRNALPSNAIPGSVSADELDPAYLADQLQMSSRDAVTGVTACVTVRLLALQDGRYTIVGWEENWGKANKELPLSDADRAARYRARKKNGPLTSASSRNVTTESDDVTDHHAIVTSHDRLDQTRSDQTRQETEETGAKAPLVLVPPSRPARGRKRPIPSYTPAELASVRVVLAKLASFSGVAYTGSPTHTALIVARLREGKTEWDLRRIAGFCAASKREGGLGWCDSDEMRPHLCPETLFGPKTHEKYLDRARSWMPDGAPEESPITERTEATS